MKLIKNCLFIFLSLPYLTIHASQPLNLVSPQTTTLKNPVHVQIYKDKNMLHAIFDVKSSDIYAKKTLSVQEYPYEYDVVELFVASKKHPFPYYEFELSPYNQAYQVKIKAPKQFINNVDMGIIHKVNRNPGGWTAELIIPLDKVGIEGDACQIIGNAFAILGKSPRTFWSLYLPPQTKPNFHKPEYFKNLINPCER